MYPNKWSLTAPQAMSFEISHSQRPTPRMSEVTKMVSKFIAFSEVNPIKIKKVDQVVPSLLLVINYPSVASYTRENEFPSHTRLLPLLGIGAKSDQQVNIWSFTVRCDRMWPSTQ